MNENAGRQMVLNEPERFPLAIHPVDKSDNYIKRCVAIAGDTFQLIDGIVHINGVAEKTPPKSVMPYTVVTKGQVIDDDLMKDEYDIDIYNPQQSQSVGSNTYIMNLTYDAFEKMKASGFASSISPLLERQWDAKSAVEPFVLENGWTLDNYGPVWIPRKGATIPINDSTFSIYQRAIRVYEKNKFEKINGQFMLNDAPVSNYTFKMDYYWMMGDNRHGSQDSRYWGFVPEDRVVGKAWMIWFSWEGGPRWKRLFNIVK